MVDVPGGVTALTKPLLVIVAEGSLLDHTTEFVMFLMLPSS